MKRFFLVFTFPTLIVIILDQVSKYIIVRAVQSRGSITVIDGFFNLVHVQNRGMAFGLLNKPDIGFMSYLLLLASIAAITLLIYWAIKLKDTDWKISLGLSLILGGAIGNMIDRIRLKEVVDFLDFIIWKFHWPSFNLADSAITIGTFGVALNLIFFSKIKKG